MQKVKCPHCHASFSADTSRKHEELGKLKCAWCAHEFDDPGDAIVDDDNELKRVDAPEGTLISVGHTRLASAAGVTADDLKWDGGKMVVRGDHLFLIGRDLKPQYQKPDGRIADGNCRAVVMFLEDVVGIRWYCWFRC